MIGVLAAPDAGNGSPGEVLAPSGVFALVLIALSVDWMSIFPVWIRDRLLFALWVTIAHAGFDGSRLDTWTVGRLEAGLRWAIEQGGGTGIAGTAADYALSVVIGVGWVWAVGSLLPEKTPRLGRFVAMELPATAQFKLNWKIIAAGMVLGMLSDLPQGAVGEMTRFLLRIMTGLVSGLPELLFGEAS